MSNHCMAMGVEQGADQGAAAAAMSNEQHVCTHVAEDGAPPECRRQGAQKRRKLRRGTAPRDPALKHASPLLFCLLAIARFQSLVSVPLVPRPTSAGPAS